MLVDVRGCAGLVWPLFVLKGLLIDDFVVILDDSACLCYKKSVTL